MNFDFENFIGKFKYDPNSVKKNYDGKTDIYLAKVSYRYAYVKRILAVLIVILVIAFVLSGNISYRRFYYLSKDIKLASDYVNSVHDTITYNVGNSQSFVDYRSGIAVASREKLSIFSSGGREIFSSNHSFGNPTLEASNKYILLYDVGGKQYALYNSFSKVNEGVLDYSIYGACISESGTFALITKTDKYDSVVKVYLQKGTEYTYNFAGGRVCSVSLSKNGHNLAVLLMFADSDDIRTEIRLYKVGESDYAKKDITFEGVPYEVKILNSGNIVAVGNGGVNAFNSSLSMVGEYLCDEEIYAYAFGKDNVAVAHLSDEAGKTNVAILNKRGKAEKTFEYSERIIDVAMYNGYLFAQKIGGFERTNISLGVTERVDMLATGFEMIASDKNVLIVCNDSYAKFLNFGR
jgi:hypothetical protein